MSTASFRVVPLDPDLDRTRFSCGVAPLDSYFQTQVTQDIRRRVTACFVALTSEAQIAGYYTLASTSVPLSSLPMGTAKKLPRYPSVPGVRVGRLAVDTRFKGCGLGGALLADAIERAAAAEIAAFAVIVDAKDEAAVTFYRHHGFIELSDFQRSLFLPIATVRPLLK